MQNKSLEKNRINKEKAIEISKRYLIMLVGLFINAVGINVITNASLGTSPITSVPYTLSLKFPFSLGEFTFIINMVLILIQLILLRKRFSPQYWLEIPLTFVLSAFIDITAHLFPQSAPENYALKIILLLIGCAILGIGVALEFVADVAMLPGEGCVNAVCLIFNSNKHIKEID